MPFFSSPIFIILLILFSILIIIILISYIECKSYIITKYSIYTNKITNKKRIIFISDLHDKSYIGANSILINDIIKLRPDYIVLGGDFIDFSAFNSIFGKLKFDNAIKFIKNLSEKYYGFNNFLNYNGNRIFFSYGNHELRLINSRGNDILKNKCDEFVKCLNKYKITILDNTKVNIDDDKMSFSGLSLYDGYYVKKFMKNKVKKNVEKDILDKSIISLNSEFFNIMSFHKPDYAEDFIDYGFDMVLSGHNHGGLIRFFGNKAIFSPDLSLNPKYNYGIYDYKGKSIIVSSGIGEHFIKIRVNNKPEICVIDINGTN